MTKTQMTLKAFGAIVLVTFAACSTATDEAGSSESGLGEGRRVIVGYRNANGRGRALGKGKTHHDLKESNAIAATLTEQAIAELKRDADVEYVEDDVLRFPAAEVTPYGVSMVRADLVTYASAPGRKLCIIDSGFDLGHPDLPTTHVTGTSNSGSGNWFEDTCGHGSHVAGTISAIGGNNEGVVGVIPTGTLNLHIVKVFSGVDCAWTYSSSLVAALQECRNAGANVVSMSLGGGRASRTEESAFNSANTAGVLSIAAAGNDGTTALSYPASYASVVSVAAIGADKAVADFSQKNAQVDLSAPGVGVRSTVPRGTGHEASVTVGSTSYEVLANEGSPDASATGSLVDCGEATAVCAAAAGRICLIKRGTNAFADKVLACQNGGGLGAIIYNNVAGELSATLGTTVTTIPSVGASDVTGAALLAQLGATTTVTVTYGTNYEKYNGTSMATPHVSAVAALVWSRFPTCTNTQIRSALEATAEDLGPAGRDDASGKGLVNAKGAVDYLTAYGCSGPAPVCKAAGATCSAGSECCSSSCVKRGGKKTCG